MSTANDNLSDPVRRWRLDTSNDLLGGLLGPNDRITDIKMYSLLERQLFADCGQAWGELVEQPPRTQFLRYDYEQRRAMPHEQLMAEAAQRQRDQQALECTADWRDMLDVEPVELTSIPPAETLRYPDEDSLSQVHVRFQQILGPHCPDIEVVRALIRTAFFASLTQEEGRRSQFSIALLALPSPEQIPPRERNDWLVFDAPKPLDIRAITKLAPACNSTQGVIAVWVNPNGRLEIWGLLHAGSSWIRQREGEPIAARFRLAPLVRVFGQGDFNVEVGPETVLEVRSGRSTSGGHPVFTHDGLVYRFLRHYGLSSTVLQRLVRGVLDLRHGGTIFIVPFDPVREAWHRATIVGTPESIAQLDSAEFKIELLRRSQEIQRRLVDLVDIRYRFRNPARLLSEAAQSWIDCHASPPNEALAGWIYMHLHSRTEAWTALDDAREMVGNMTAVDGALVVGTDLAVIGFGAVVKDIQQVPRAYLAQNVEGSHVLPYDFQYVGTRHRSAICFCQQWPEALAIIASQDGGLSCARFWPRLGGVVVSSAQINTLVKAPPAPM